MSNETPAPEADPTANSPAGLQEFVATNVAVPEVAAEDAPAPEAAEEEVPGGGVLGDHVRKAVADVREVEAVLAGDARITREHLAEITLRRAQADIPTLIAACGALLDELEA